MCGKSIPKSGMKLDGKELSRIILGTHSFGTATPQTTAFSLMDLYVGAGGNVLDTAAAYGDGISERCIGRWMAERKNREQIVLCSKCGNPELRDGRFIRHRINKEDIRADIERGLENLGTDHFDVYFVHKDDPSLAPAQVIDLFQEYLRNGTIRHLGASNWSLQRIGQANDYAREHGLRGLEFSELAFSLQELDANWEANEERMIQMGKADFSGYCENRMPVFGFNAQAYGYFYKNFDLSEEEMSGSAANKGTLMRLREVCQKENITVWQGLFGAYFGSGIQSFPIVTTSKEEHLLDVINNCDVTLSHADARYIFGKRFFD